MHNSYNSSDSINDIDWNLKRANADQFKYYQQLIRLRKEHPAFRLSTAEDVARHLVFDKQTEPNLISYTLRDNANGDIWRDIKVVFNGSETSQTVKIPKGKWTVIARDGELNADGLGTSTGGKMEVAPLSALILARE